MTASEGDVDLRFTIPKNSYTAFRLKYCDALELYNTSSVLFLGNIPPAWILDKKSVLLANLYRLNNLDLQKKTESNDQHPQHSTLSNFEDVIHKVGKNDNNTHPIYHELHKVDRKIQNHTINRIFKRKESTKLSKNARNGSLTNSTNRDEPRTRGNITAVPALNVRSTENKKLEGMTDSEESTISRTHNFFYSPRETLHSEHMKFCAVFPKIMEDRDSDSDTSNEDGENTKSSLKGDEERYSPAQILPVTTREEKDQDSNVSIFVSPNDFLNKPISEKRELLREEINVAMISLSKSRDTDISGFTPGEVPPFTESTDDSSFITAEESLSGEDINVVVPMSEKRASISFEVPEPIERKTVSFGIPASVPLANAQSAYTIRSQHQMLNKQLPAPYQRAADSMSLAPADDIKKGTDQKDVFEISVNQIDESVAHDYDLLKTRTIGAKLGLAHEIDKLERKRRYKKLVKNFQTGDIIKMEKMLVLVSTIEKLRLNKETNQSSRILERWREYIIVVRATNDVDYPAVIQFFKSNRIFRKDKASKLKEEIYENKLEKQQMEGFDDDDADDAESVDVVANCVLQNEESVGEPDDLTLGRGIDQALESGCIQSTSDKIDKKILRSPLRTMRTRKKKEKAKRIKLHLKEKLVDDIADTTGDDRYHFSLVLSREDTTIRFANLLDKSICISKEKRAYTAQYTLLAHSPSSAIMWFSFLRHLLEPPSVREISKREFLIGIPSLNISFAISGLPSIHARMLLAESKQPDDVLIRFTETGYQYPKIESFNITLDMIVAKLRDLEEAGRLPSTLSSKQVLHKLKKDRSFLALSFRKYDRLEWILGENEAIIENLWTVLGSSFELELREFEHESHALLDGSLTEPLPIEGFVVKLSNRSGQHKTKLGRQYYKLLYAFTADNLLFLHNFYEAVPSFPNSENSPYHYITPAGDVLDIDELEEAASFAPAEYLSAPYPRAGNHVEWLKPGISTEEYLEKDSNALFQAERRACMVSSAKAVVDLCKVTDIKLVPKNEINLILKATGKTTWGHSPPNIRFNVDEGELLETCFDLVMDDGSSLRFQVSTKTIRNEWAKSLSRLSAYWTAKRHEALVRGMLMREKNLDLMNACDDNYESQVANESSTSCSKWELAKAYTDSQLYNISAYALDKPILMEGYLYYKKFKGKQFRVVHAVLSPGFMVLYDSFNRSKITGVAGKCTYHRRFAAISLANCYVFARVGKSNTEVKSKILSNSLQGSNGMPRLYGDGLRSGESIEERSFTLWFGSKKMMIENVKKKTGTTLNYNLERGISPVVDEELSGQNGRKDGSVSETTENSKKFGLRKLKEKIKRHSKRGSSDRTPHDESRSSHLSIQGDNDTGDSPEYSSNSEVSDTETSSIDDDSESESYSYSDSDSESTSDASESYYEDESFQHSPPQDEKPSKKELFQSMKHFGVAGHAAIFLSRSRVERDVWVTRLMSEVERFSGKRNESIELV
jgi:hypothetical protein